MPEMTGGQAVVASLQAQGVDTVFGIISVHTLDLFDALFDRQDEVRFIGGRLELGCGYMADGYARATGKPGVLLTSTGPGAADSVGAMGGGLLFGVVHIAGNHQCGGGVRGQRPDGDPRNERPAGDVRRRYRLERAHRADRVHTRPFCGSLCAFQGTASAAH